MLARDRHLLLSQRKMLEVIINGMDLKRYKELRTQLMREGYIVQAYQKDYYQGKGKEIEE